MTRAVATLALWLGLLVGPALADGPSDPELLFEVPWSGGPLSFSPAGNERPARGPNALSVGPDGIIWILDDLAHRLVGFSPSGTLTGLVPLPGQHHDLVAAAADGSFVVYSAYLRKLTQVDAAGQVLSERRLPIHLAAVRALGFAADEHLQIEDPHGQRFDLGPLAEARPDAAVLLDRHYGPPGSTTECGLRKRAGKIQLLSWPSPQGPTSGREPAAKTETLTLEGVGSAHLVSRCGSGSMLVELELLSPHGPLSVQREVALLSGSAVIGQWRLPIGWPYVPAGRFASGAREIMAIHPQPGGLQVIRWRLP